VSAEEEKVPARALFAKPYLGRMLIVLGFWFIFYVAMYGYASYLPVLLEGIGISTSDAIFVTVLSRIAPLLSVVAVVLLVERMERRAMIVAGTLMFAASLLLIALNLGEGIATLGALMSSFGIAFMATPAYTYTAEVFPTRARGTAAAIADVVRHLGGAVTPFVVLPVLSASPSGWRWLLAFGALVLLVPSSWRPASSGSASGHGTARSPRSLPDALISARLHR
jgi:putative MFS transporter